MTSICEFCESEITKYNLIKHKKSDYCAKIYKLLQKREEKYKIEINKIETQNINKLQEKDDILNKLYEKISKLTQENTILKSENKSLEKSNESFRKIVEKAATKTTNTIKNNNYTHNNYLNYISNEPLKISEFPKQLKQFVNCDTIMYDDDDFHEHIVDNILRDKSGKDKVLCTDINRKNFTYKDEKSGELISDPELERLRDQLKKGTDIRKIRRDLLEKLVIDYEENGNIGTDPYKQFSEIIQKLNFGTPFIDHVAKKTYIKSKNIIQELSSETNSETSIQENPEILITNKDNFDYSEEEYQNLLKEFGNDI